jgi:mannose-6-phosphate isomerase-like protein (cupin superfamily)
MKLVFISALFAVFALSAQAQSQQGAEIFPSSRIHDQFTQFHRQPSSSSTLGDYGTHAIRLSERTTSGGAEIHAHFDDVMYVTEGTATLITGGEVIDPHTATNGETTGSGIRNGQSHSVAAGDIIHVPAGTPHQTIITPGALYRVIVIKVKE